MNKAMVNPIVAWFVMSLATLAAMDASEENAEPPAKRHSNETLDQLSQEFPGISATVYKGPNAVWSSARGAANLDQAIPATRGYGLQHLLHLEGGYCICVRLLGAQWKLGPDFNIALVEVVAIHGGNPTRSILVGA